MDRCSWLLRRASVVSTLLLAILLAASLTSFAQSKPEGDELKGVEKDNPLERLKAQERQFGRATPAYRDKVFQEVEKQNQRIGRNSNGAAQGTPGQSTTGPMWINIGPFGQQFGTNGNYTSEETDSGRLRTILVHPTDPNIVYILSSAGGLWKTTNFQDAYPQWAPMTDFLPSTAGGAAAFGKNPNTIYLGLGDPYDQITVGGAMTKSTDGGTTWSPVINLGLTVSIRDVKVDTSDPNNEIVLVATDGGLYRSADSGKTYVQVTGHAFQDQFIWSIAQTSAGWVIATQETMPITNGTCAVGFRWCVGRGHIYLSTDKGLHWNEQANGLDVFGRTTLAVGAAGDATIYAYSAVQSTSGSAALDLKDLYRSTDGGKTWVAMGVNSTKIPVNPVINYSPNMNVMNGQAWYNQTILVDPSDSTRNTVYLGGTYFSAKSTDGGASWRVLSEWLPGYAGRVGSFSLPYVHADMHTMAFKSTGDTPMVLLGTDGGIFASTDGGITWDSRKNTNLVTHMFYALIGNPQNPSFVMGGLQDNGTRARAGNTGIFNQTQGGDGFGVAMSQANTATQFQSVYYNQLRGWRTGIPVENFNEGFSSLPRQSSSSSPFYTPVVSPSPTADPSGLIFFSQGLTRLYKTVNGGVNWTAFSTIGSTTGLSGVSFRDSPFGLSVSPANISHLAVGTNGGRVYVSLDGGVSWTYHLGTDSVQGWPGFVSSVSWADDNTIWASSNTISEGLYTGVPTVRVVKSTDQGNTWVAAGNGLPDVQVTRVYPDPRDTSIAYAATHIGVYRTTDGGASWAPYGAGLPNVRVNDIYMPPDGGYIRIATYGRGIWQLSNIDYVGATLVDDGASCEHNGSIGNNETGHLVLTFSNPSAFSVAGGTVTVTSDNGHLAFTAGNNAPIGTIAAHGTVSIPLAVKVTGATGIETANLTIAYGDTATMTIKRPISINYDDVANASGTAVSWESTKSGFTVNTVTPLKPGDVTEWTRREFKPVISTGSHIMAVGDANAVQDTALVSPVLKVGASNFSFTFTHRFFTENTYDGGIIEISNDGGANWSQVTTGITYNGTLVAGGPLGAVPAFTGLSTGWPATISTTVDLGTTYANQNNVKIRFRAGADENSGGPGWEIYDVTFAGLTNTPFGAIVAHNEVCPGTTASMVSTANPSNYPDQVTLTATVAGGVTPVTGTVSFKEGATVLGSSAAVDGTANFNTSTLSVGTHYIVASFAGDAGHAPIDAAAYKHTVLAVPRTTMTPPSLDFGDIRTGQTSTVMTSVLKNTGTAPLIISGLTGAGDFTATNNCSTSIAANGTCTISVTFKPVNVQGARTGSVTLAANGVSGDAVLTLTGNAVRPVSSPSKTSLAYANTLVSASAAAQSIVITNTGNLPLNISDVAVSGTGAPARMSVIAPVSDYAQTNDCTAGPIAAGATCTVNVTFTPTAAGSRPGTLTITSDADNSPQAFAMTGKGEMLQITGTTAQTVSVQNKATFPLTLKSSSAFAGGAVSLTCAGAPSLTSCSFDNAAPTVTAGGTANVTVSVTPTPTTSSAAHAGQALFAMTGLFGLMLLPLTRKQSGRKVLSMIVLALVITASVGGMVACGGSGTPAPATPTTHYAAPGTYTLTVTASSGGTVLQTQTLTLTLQ